MALYGIENSHPSECQLHKLQTAIVEALGHHSARRSLHMSFELLSRGDDLDPHVQQLTKRVDTFRRMWKKHPRCHHQLRSIWASYSARKVGGACCDATDVLGAQVAPHVDTNGRNLWRMPNKTNGPLGYLMHSLWQVGAAIDNRFTIHKDGEP